MRSSSVFPYKLLVIGCAAYTLRNLDFNCLTNSTVDLSHVKIHSIVSPIQINEAENENEDDERRKRDLKIQRKVKNVGLKIVLSK